MDGNHPKNKDLRPKRRKDRDNPYTIFTSGIDTDSPNYFLAFTDSQEIRHCMEIDRELFDTLDRFELDDLSMMNEMDNHYEHSELSEESLNAQAANPPESLEDTVFTKHNLPHIHPHAFRHPYVKHTTKKYTAKQPSNSEICLTALEFCFC